ncbi:MAG: hypothetical protein HYZ23_03120 [Chloroflexi bacterium]|nr:hypothetical protein [Chloroflexota bacterium]
MSVYVTRPSGWLSVNAGVREFILSSDGKSPMKFKDRKEAIAYMLSIGLNDFTYFEFPVVCPICTNPLEEENGECLLCGRRSVEE